MNTRYLLGGFVQSGTHEPCSFEAAACSAETMKFGFGSNCQHTMRVLHGGEEHLLGAGRLGRS